jgi:hypothetical protein
LKPCNLPLTFHPVEQLLVSHPSSHPDDMIVDFRRNTLAIHGSMDKRELADLDLWLTRRHGHKAELQTLIEDKA